jgi:hypothetical protein
MKIDLAKFGTTLTSRQLGKEAFAAFSPLLENVGESELVEVDFDGVNTFSPSWGAEFLTPLINMFPGRVFLNNTTNPSVKITLELLENIIRKKFQIKQ